MNRIAFATLALAAGAVAFSTPAADAQLAHRYSFDTDASDSVGTADGTLLANGTITGGSLVTTGTASATTGVTLPSAAVAGIDGSFTIQHFYTSTAPQGNFAVGNSFSDRGAVNGTDDPNGQGNVLLFQPRRGDEGNPSSYATIAPTTNGGTGGLVTVLGATADAAGVAYDALFSYDAGTGVGSYYLNGELQNSSPMPPTDAPDLGGLNLSTKGALIGINGSGPFVNDPGLNGSTDDFRIFNVAVSGDQAAALNGLGAGASNDVVNAAVNAIPEPTTLGLLGVAGLGLLRRRRA